MIRQNFGRLEIFKADFCNTLMITGVVGYYQLTAFWDQRAFYFFPEFFPNTVVPGFSVLGFRALPWFRAITGNQICVYLIDLPGFSALPGFRAPFCGNGQSTLNPGTTVYPMQLQQKTDSNRKKRMLFLGSLGIFVTIDFIWHPLVYNP